MRFLLWLSIASAALAGEFTTSLGDAYPYTISAVAADSAGNTYVVGSRRLSDSTDVFVSKLDPNGKLLFTNRYGGAGSSTGSAIALDPSGNIYIGGTTTASDFPLSKALQTQLNGAGSGFIMKLSNDGAAILYATYFGGTQGTSSIAGLATDSKGNLYITGSTFASDYPQTASLPKLGFAANSGTIVAEISAAGDRIVYSGAMAPVDRGAPGGPVGIAVDAAGNAYIGGYVNDSSLPTTPGVLLANGSGAYVAKVNAGGAGIGYATYLGSGGITLEAIQVDATGNAYLGGLAINGFLPTTPGSLQPIVNAPRQTVQLAFLAKLNPTGTAMVWSTYIGGTAEGIVRSLAVDANGNVWATGNTQSASFPNANGWTAGGDFLIGLNATGSQLNYSAQYQGQTVGQSVAVDSSGLIHAVGTGSFVSSINPGAPPAMKIFDFQNAFGSGLTVRLAPAEIVAIYGPGIGPTAPVIAAATNGSFPTTLGGVQVSMNGASIPLLYVSANQINAVVPMGVATGAAATVRVTNGAAVSPDYPVWIIPSAPLAYQTVVNQDGSLNSQSNPAPGGSIVTFYATGWQPNFSPAGDGQISRGANDVCFGKCVATAVTPVIPICVGFCFGPASLPGNTQLAATVMYGGDAPSVVAGLSQLNVQLGTLPASAGTNSFNLTVSGGPVSGNSLGVVVWVKP